MVKIALYWVIASTSISLAHACLRYEPVDLEAVEASQVESSPLLSLKEVAADALVEVLLSQTLQENACFFALIPDDIKNLLKLALIRKRQVRCTMAHEFAIEQLFDVVRRDLFGKKPENSKITAN